MIELRLRRFTEIHGATIGRLAYPGGGECYTLEEAWRDNQPKISCIPKGSYALARDTFKGRYPNYRLVEVPGRTAIELHIGNSVVDTEGCILLGSLVLLGTANALLMRSQAAFAAFMERMDGAERATLVVA